MKNRVIIIGGGAAGLAAAIASAKQHADVTILEHNDCLGKKILSTGNGKCNLTNQKMEASCFHSSQTDFPMQVIGQFGVSETLAFFKSLGLYPKIKNGYVYPWSEQAASVRELLCNEVQRRDVKLVFNCQIKAIKPCPEGGFIVETKRGVYASDALILATGSKAAPATGSDGSGYRLAEKLGHPVITPLPALVQLCCEGKHYKQMAGVRTEVRLQLLVDGQCVKAEAGELQLTDYGISGIPTFQLSRHVSNALLRKRRVEMLIDFLPSMSVQELQQYWQQKMTSGANALCGDIMLGALNKKLTYVLLALAGISDQDKMTAVPPKKWQQFLVLMKQYPARITATKSYEQAQICCGGVDTTKVNAQTMESKMIRKLYFAGEILDVDGICGGYNLQFAWSSGMIAGTQAAAIH